MCPSRILSFVFLLCPLSMCVCVCVSPFLPFSPILSPIFSPILFVSRSSRRSPKPIHIELVALCNAALQCVVACGSVWQCVAGHKRSLKSISFVIMWLFSFVTVGWLRLAGSLKLEVSFAKEPYKRDCILQKRPIILRSLLIIATPYVYACVCVRVCVTWRRLYGWVCM